MAKRIEHAGNNRHQRLALSEAQGREMYDRLGRTKPDMLPRPVAERIKTARRTCWDN